MKIVKITPKNRDQVNKLIIDNWHSTEMVVRGKIIDMTELEGYITYEKDCIIGLITYILSECELEIISLDSFQEQQGIGTALVNKIIKKAKGESCHTVKLITTNDNLNALKFYQKRGFELVRIYKNAIEKSRAIKQSIPLIGNDGIPIRDEIELQYIIESV
ncbi:GNAT family N-acetyltransferase [Clostridiaceae bacterium M8S5]|nr:GNAT family N-acetyltransferase [Clostridiaceae bacterium M8S5]